MKNEQERLAALIARDGGLEPVDGASLLERGLREAIQVNPTTMKEIEQEIRNRGEEIEGRVAGMAGVARQMRTASNSGSLNIPTVNSEKLLVELFNLRDGLIRAFETCTLNNKTSNILNEQIIRTGKCINELGGEVTAFEPFNHVSGLTMPNFIKNAHKVIETTVQCYSLGEIEDSHVSSDGKQVVIVFSGSNADVEYKARGTITAQEWTGNEAIDYIYTPGSGHMSVKAYENGRWVSKDANKNYQVVWELEESDLSAKETAEEKKEVKISTMKKEIATNNKNIIAGSDRAVKAKDSDDEDISSPIK